MSLLWPDYVNRDLQLNPEQRREIHRRAWKLWGAKRWNVVLHVALCLVCLLALLNAADFGGQVAAWVGLGGFAWKACRAASLLVVIAGSAVFVRAVLARYRFAPCVYRATRQLGYDVCGKCGYWLKGLNADITRCPECGAEREPLPDSGST
jgi:hypothetical protein